MDLILMIIIAIVILIILALSIRIVNQYERGVVFRVGKVIGVREPGLRFIIPLVDRMVKPSLRIVTMPIPSQKIITQDNVSIDVAAVAYFKVIDAYKAVVEIENYNRAVNQISQTTVRSVWDSSPWMRCCRKRPRSTRRSRRSLMATVNHGVSKSPTWKSKTSNYQTACKGLLPSKQKLKGKRAKIISAEGEYLAAGKLGEAADIISEHPVALQLRIMQVLSNIAAEQNSTIVFPAQLLNSIRDIKDFMGSELEVMEKDKK
jgi:Membrane protease subunits, stomatin/prohibitin homologs